jgi:hypothetical protein
LVIILAVALVALIVSGATIHDSQGQNTGGSSQSTESPAFSSSTASGVTPSVEVSNALLNHLLNIVSKNVSAVLGDYQSNATVEWKGETFGLPGNYTGTARLDSLYTEFLTSPNLVNFIISNVTINSIGFGAGAGQGNAPVAENPLASLNYTLQMRGYSENIGNWSATINAGVRYSWTDHSWLISGETWDYVAQHSQHPFVF